MKFYYFYPLCNNYYFTVKGYQIGLTEFVLDKYMVIIISFEHLQRFCLTIFTK